MNIRPIEIADNEAMAKVIRDVMTEFGACGPGFSINDPEVDTMFESYQGERHIYFVLTNEEDEVIGGGGIAPLTEGATDLCELRKMYFAKEARGKGLGQKLLDICLQYAKQFSFKRCYLETLKGMDGAEKLYKKNEFLPLDGPMGATGHFGCDKYYLKEL